MPPSLSPIRMRFVLHALPPLFNVTFSLLFHADTQDVTEDIFAPLLWLYK